MACNVVLPSAQGVSNPIPLSSLDGLRDWLLFRPAHEFLIRDPFWPSDAQDLAKAGVDDQIQSVNNI